VCTDCETSCWCFAKWPVVGFLGPWSVIPGYPDAICILAINQVTCRNSERGGRGGQDLTRARVKRVRAASKPGPVSWLLPCRRPATRKNYMCLSLCTVAEPNRWVQERGCTHMVMDRSSSRV
jgi:hypothetical protein